MTTCKVTYTVCPPIGSDWIMRKCSYWPRCCPGHTLYIMHCIWTNKRWRKSVNWLDIIGFRFYFVIFDKKKIKMFCVTQQFPMQCEEKLSFLVTFNSTIFSLMWRFGGHNEIIKTNLIRWAIFLKISYFWFLMNSLNFCDKRFSASLSLTTIVYFLWIMSKA